MLTNLIENLSKIKDKLDSIIGKYIEFNDNSDSRNNNFMHVESIKTTLQDDCLNIEFKGTMLLAESYVKIVPNATIGYSIKLPSISNKDYLNNISIISQKDYFDMIDYKVQCYKAIVNKTLV